MFNLRTTTPDGRADRQLTFVAQLFAEPDTAVPWQAACQPNEGVIGHLENPRCRIPGRKHPRLAW
jgi:hypothetical protein